MIANPDRELDDIRRRLEAAENDGDADAIIEMMADDCVLLVPDFPIQEGKAACAAFVREVTAFQRAHFDRHITYVSTEMRLVGSVAFDRGSFSFDATDKSEGHTTHARGRYLWLYSHAEDGSWKLSFAIETLEEASGTEGPC